MVAYGKTIGRAWQDAPKQPIPFNDREFRKSYVVALMARMFYYEAPRHGFTVEASADNISNNFTPARIQQFMDLEAPNGVTLQKPALTGIEIQEAAHQLLDEAHLYNDYYDIFRQNLQLCLGYILETNNKSTRTTDLAEREIDFLAGLEVYLGREMRAHQIYNEDANRLFGLQKMFEHIRSDDAVLLPRIDAYLKDVDLTIPTLQNEMEALQACQDGLACKRETRKAQLA